LLRSGEKHVRSQHIQKNPGEEWEQDRFDQQENGDLQQVGTFVDESASISEGNSQEEIEHKKIRERAASKPEKATWLKTNLREGDSSEKNGEGKSVAE
jgi:hypothetical protein